MLLFLIFINFLFSADIDSVFGSKSNEVTSSEKVFGDSKSSNKASSSSVFSNKKSIDSNTKKVFGTSKSSKGGIKNVLDTSRAFIWPIKGDFTLTSGYGWRSSRRFHDGVDLTASKGTPIIASRAGKVIYSDKRIGGYGNMVIIKHSGNMYTVYAHNKENLIGKGMYVRQGEEIAIIGNTGRSTGRHLHFEVRKGKYSVNPMKYLKK